MKYQKNETITLAHGSGGKAAGELIQSLCIERFNNPHLARLEDQARLELPPGRIALTTDSFVITPLFFNGGDIGKLAVTGTVNDLVVGGAHPHYLSCALILEEGLPVATLDRVLQSMQETAQEAGVEIVCGDTKVVEKGSADQLFINTTGLGTIPQDVDISATRARVGDQVIVSGNIGDHGATIMQHRAELALSATISSDCQLLNHLVEAMLKAAPEGVHAMRDATRGGVASVLHEIASSADLSISLDETAIPVDDQTRAICEILGLEPLYLANEGTLVALVSADVADHVLQAMHSVAAGKHARIIGQVTQKTHARLALTTVFGGSRIIDRLTGDQLPRIC